MEEILMQYANDLLRANPSINQEELNQKVLEKRIALTKNPLLKQRMSPLWASPTAKCIRFPPFGLLATTESFFQF